MTKGTSIEGHNLESDNCFRAIDNPCICKFWDCSRVRSSY
nr:MAG TPA: hypothetical protein [Caudoviricetes sp.]